MTKSPRPRVRAVAAVLAPLAILLALLSWGLSSPPGSSPDDDYHLASIWCAAGEVDGRCEAATDPDERFVPPGVRHAIYNTGLSDLTFIVVTAPPEDAEPGSG